MPQRLPLVPSVPFSRFTTQINDVSYRFDQTWNNREVAWYLDIYEADDTPIALGVKIVLGVYLGRRTDHALFNTGVLQAFDLSGVGIDAAFDDLGTRVEVWYLTVDDLVAQVAPSEKVAR